MVNINEYVWNHRSTKDTKSEFWIWIRMSNVHAIWKKLVSPSMGPAIHALDLWPSHGITQYDGHLPWREGVSTGGIAWYSSLLVHILHDFTIWSICYQKKKIWNPYSTYGAFMWRVAMRSLWCQALGSDAFFPASLSTCWNVIVNMGPKSRSLQKP